jgi:hypothetical protein
MFAARATSLTRRRSLAAGTAFLFPSPHSYRQSSQRSSASTPLKPTELEASTRKARMLVRAGIATAGVVTYVGQAGIAEMAVQLAESTSTERALYVGLCVGGAGSIIAGLAALNFIYFRAPQPLYSLPITIVGGTLAGVVSALLAFLLPPGALPAFLAVTFTPALLGAEAGTRIARYCGTDRDAFSHANTAICVALIVTFIIQLTKDGIYYTSSSTTPDKEYRAMAFKSFSATLAAFESTLGTAWCALNVGAGIRLFGRLSPLSAALAAVSITSLNAISAAAVTVYFFEITEKEQPKTGATKSLQ